MTILARVRDKKTGLERTTTPKAYSVIPHRYTLLGYVDESGNPVDAPTNVDNNVGEKVEKKRSLAVERVVEDKSGLLVPEKPRVTREDLDRMNAEAMQKAKDRIEAKKKEEKARTGENIELTVESVGLPKTKKKPVPPKKKARA